MLTFLLFIIILTIVPDAIICSQVLPTLGLFWKFVICIPSIVIWFSWFGFIAKYLPHNFGLRLFFFTLILLAFPKLLFALFALPFGIAISLIISFITFLTFVYGFTKGWLRLSVKEESLYFPDLPEMFDGYNILQISDLHLGTFENHPEYIEKIVRKANEMNADLIVFTGDLINISGSEAKPFIDILSKLDSKDGILSILGNHDYSDIKTVKDIEKQLNWKLLLNESHTIKKGDNFINIIGVEQIGIPPFKSTGDLNLAMQDTSEDSFRILLTHDPSHWGMEVTERTNIQLTLSGHTHAAQMKIGRFSPARFIYKEWGGKYTNNRQTLYVSIGIGGTIPFRLGAWPEINKITLRKQQKSKIN